MIRDHPALATAAAGLIAVAARLLAISRFDINTATTVLERSGSATVAAGTVLALLPFALVLVTSLLAVVTFLDHGLLDVPSGWLPPLLALSAGATLSMTALPLAGFTIVVILAAAAGRLALKGSSANLRESFRASRLLRIQGTVLLVAVALAPVVLQRPWFPTQSVHLRDGRVIIGYALGSADPELAILRDSDRTVIFIQADQITAREICSGAPSVGGAAGSIPRFQMSGSLLGTLLWGDRVPKYPACPEAKP